MKRDENEFDDLPEALIQELRASDESVPLITARVDREVLKMAREQFGTRRPVWRKPAWAAAAAAVVLALFIVPQPYQRDAMLVEAPRQPDISDVLRLAREAQGTPGAQAEIDALAYRVVSLSRPGDAQ